MDTFSQIYHLDQSNFKDHRLPPESITDSINSSVKRGSYLHFPGRYFSVANAIIRETLELIKISLTITKKSSQFLSLALSSACHIYAVRSYLRSRGEPRRRGRSIIRDIDRNQGTGIARDIATPSKTINHFNCRLLVRSRLHVRERHRPRLLRVLHSAESVRHPRREHPSPGQQEEPDGMWNVEAYKRRKVRRNVISET